MKDLTPLDALQFDQPHRQQGACVTAASTDCEQMKDVTPLALALAIDPWTRRLCGEVRG